MSKAITSFKDGITPAMEAVSAMTLNKSTDLNPGHQALNTKPPDESQSRRNSGLTVMSQPTPTEPIKLHRVPTAGKRHATSFATRLGNYPLSRSLKRSTVQPRTDPIHNISNIQQIKEDCGESIEKPTKIPDNKDKPHNILERKDRPSNIMQSKDKPSAIMQIKNKPLNILESKIKPPNIIDNKNRPPNIAVSKVKPPNIMISEVEPPNIVVCEVKPPNIVISEVKPPNIVISEIKPPNIVVCEVKPPNIGVGEVKPPNIVVGEVKPPNIVVGEVKPPNIIDSKGKPQKIMGSEDRPAVTMEMKIPENDIPSRNTSSLVDTPVAARAGNDPPQQMFVLRKLNSSETMQKGDSFDSKDTPPSIMNSEDRPAMEIKVPEKDILGRNTSSLIDTPVAARAGNDLPQQMFVLRKLNSPKTMRRDNSFDSKDTPPSIMNSETRPAVEIKVPEKDIPGRNTSSLIDTPVVAPAVNDPPQQMFVLRKLNSPETMRRDDSFKRRSLIDDIQPRSLSTLPKQGETTSSQILNSTFHIDPDTDWMQPRLPGNNFLSPRDLGSVKARSESALSTLHPPDQSLDLRRHSSQNCLVPPENLISSNPRRDSAWTAEVLSIEIQVDYIMDPQELWGQNKTPVEDTDNTETVVLDLYSMDTPVTDDLYKDQKSEEIPEVGDFIPVVTESHDDDGEDDKRSDNSVENGVPPEKAEPTKDPLRSRDSIDLNLPPREHWQNRGQFLLSTIGYAVDLSNVWRFPFLCYKNGGGAFLIPYFITLIFGAMPVFFMEMCLGQFHRCGPTAIWEKMSPMFKGIGMASCFMAYIVGFYYNVIIAWSFFYLFASFTTKLPWTTCFNRFNSENCWQIDWDTNTSTDNSSSTTTESAGVLADPKAAGSPRPLNRTYNVSISVSATIEYFERGMLELHHSKGLDDLGVVKWQLALCTILTFTVLYFCLWKGVKSTGKVVYVTATLPYLIMTILLVRGVLLPGAGDGIWYFITPKIESLQRPKVWIDAAVQIFFSIGSGFGTHIAYASYNKFNNNCKRDCILTVAVNSFTSLFSGVVIFSYLGHMSLKTQKDIDKVATEGPGLVFIVYPEAIATLPGSVFWAIIFFFMLLALGLDSAFGGLESPLTGLRDELSQLVKYRYFREVATFIIIVSAFLFAIPCVLQGGVYVFTILDTFAAGTSIVFIVLCEVVAVAWFYGTPQFSADVEKMIGEKPSIFWRICWKFVCPILLTLIVVSSIIAYQPLTYRSSQGVYTFPYYANIIGWCIACSSMCMVPAYIVYRLLRNKGSCSQRFALGISPESEHEEILQKQVVTRFQRQHWLSI